MKLFGWKRTAKMLSAALDHVCDENAELKAAWITEAKFFNEKSMENREKIEKLERELEAERKLRIEAEEKLEALHSDQEEAWRN